MTQLESITDEALDAFWQIVVQHFPQATSGGLSPGATVELDIAANSAVQEWVYNNVLTQQARVAVGYCFTLFHQVDRFPDFSAPSGLTGVVTVVDDNGVWGRMDQPLAGAEQWENQIHWDSSYDFAQDTVPL